MQTRMITIYSGGQTGVDRAVLDAILDYKNPDQFCVRGWCPKGRRAEDGQISNKYPLTETESEDYSQRTEWNIRDSQAILILLMSTRDKGTDYAVNKGKEMKKHVKEVDISTDKNLAELFSWIVENKIERLNISGPREGNCPGIYNHTYQFVLEFVRYFSTCSKTC